MLRVDERVAHLEGHVSEQSHALVEIRDAVGSLERRVDARFEAVDRRFEAVDRRFEAVDRRFEAVDRRFDTVERRLDGLDEKLSRHFVWLVGIQLTTLVAIVSALLARV